MTTPSRRGFSLLELMFTLLLTSLVVGAIYFIYHNQSSIAYKVEHHQEALRSSLFCLERLSREMKQLVTVPVEKVVNESDGTVRIERRYGDHLTPVAISPLGREISFYIPAPGPIRAENEQLTPRAVTFSLVPSGENGTYYIERTEGETVRRMAETTVRELRFRLLEPGCSNPQRCSPDEDFYVEVYVRGTDRLNKRRHSLHTLVHLDYPSRHRHFGSYQRQHEYVAPEEPLQTGQDTFVVSTLESRVVGRLKDLAEQFRQGTLSAEAFEQAASRAINAVSNKPVTPLFSGSSARIPNFDKLTVRPTGPGEPLVLSDSLGRLIALLNSPQQLRALMESLQAGGAQNSSPWFVDISAMPTPGTNSSLLAGLGMGETFGPLATPPSTGGTM